MLSRIAVAQETASGALWHRKLPGRPPERHVFLGVNRERLASPLMTRFTDFLRDFFAE